MNGFVWHVIDTTEGRILETPDLERILGKSKRVCYETHAGFMVPELERELDTLQGRDVDVKVLDSLPRYDDAYEPLRNKWNGKTLNGITGGRLSRNAYTSQIRIDNSMERNTVSRFELEEFFAGSPLANYGAALPASSTLGELQASIYFAAIGHQTRQRGVKISSYEFEKNTGAEPAEHMRKHTVHDAVFLQLLKSEGHADYLMGRYRQARADHGYAPRYVISSRFLHKPKTQKYEVVA